MNAPVISRFSTALLAAPFAAFVLACALAVTPAGAAELNVSGTWDAVYHCEAGSCKGQEFPAPGVKLVQAPGSTHVQAGTDAEGTLNGHVLTLEGGSGGYHFTETVTISEDGKSWSGPLSDSMGRAGRIRQRESPEARKKVRKKKNRRGKKKRRPPKASTARA